MIEQTGKIGGSKEVRRIEMESGVMEQIGEVSSLEKVRGIERRRTGL